MQNFTLQVNGENLLRDGEGYMHEIFPKGGPQKQGNRLAGVRKLKGEH